MLNHYVPRFYLRGFTREGSDSQVWVFDREKERFFPAGVGNVGAIHGFYDDDVEEQLNRSVEMPGNSVLNKVRTREAISPTDKARLAFYIAVLMMRVPHKRKRALEMVPDVVDDTITEAYREIQALAADASVSAELVEKRLAEVEGLRDKLKEQPPPGLVEDIESPWPSRNIVNAVTSMRWRFGLSAGPSYFLTSDNPAFFFSCYGLGTENSELTFPISSDVVLFGDRRGPQLDSPPYLELEQFYVKEANRRLASEATRFIFYRERKEWISAIAKKKEPYLSRIMWGDA